MKGRWMAQHLAAAFTAVKDLLALAGAAAVLAFLVLPLREPAEKALPVLQSLVIDQLIAAPIRQVSVTEVPLNREQQAMVEYIAKRYRVAEDAAGQFVSIAYDAGAKHSVDPLLILAVMAIESRYNPVAESVAGARGLMQVIGKYHPEKLEPHGGEEVLLEPEINIRIGAQILREYLGRFGDLETALQVYNGALDEPTSRYANKVFAEKAQLDALRAKVRKSRPTSA